MQVLKKESVKKLVSRAVQSGNKNPSNAQLCTLALAISDKESARFLKDASVKELSAVRNFIKESSKEKTAATPAIIWSLNKMATAWHGDQGADPDDVSDFGDIEKGVARTPEEFWSALEGFLPAKENWWVYDDRAETNLIEDADSMPIDSVEEQDRILAGGGKLWLADYMAYIELGDGSEVTPEKLSALLGIPIESPLSSGGQPVKEEVPTEEGLLSSKKTAAMYPDNKPEPTPEAKGGDMFGLDASQSKIAFDNQKNIYTYTPEAPTSEDEKSMREREKVDPKHPETSDVAATVSAVTEPLKEKVQFPEILNRSKTGKDALESEADKPKVQASKKTASLMESLSGAEYVEHAPEQGLAYVWFGGSMINIYTEDGQEVDVWTMGGIDPDTKPTKEDVKNSIQNHKEYMAEQEGGELEASVKQATKKLIDAVKAKVGEKKTAQIPPDASAAESLTMSGEMSAEQAGGMPGTLVIVGQDPAGNQIAVPSGTQIQMISQSGVTLVKAGEKPEKVEK